MESGQTGYVGVMMVCDDIPAEACAQPIFYSSLGSKRLIIKICRGQRKHASRYYVEFVVL